MLHSAVEHITALRLRPPYVVACTNHARLIELDLTTRTRRETLLRIPQLEGRIVYVPLLMQIGARYAPYFTQTLTTRSLR